jgi:UDP-2,4-diacetamido-2,4,6-trideoxy-beta-L-altropyranose hydrolase
MRCLALAQAWKDSGGGVVFITACESDGLLQRLSDEGFQIVSLEQSYPDLADWETTSQVLIEHPDAWVVLDGYDFDESYQQRVKEAGHRLLVIDDMAHLEHYYADIVLNQNLHAEQLHYCCKPYTQLLLGTEYVLLRREFLKWKDWKREIPEIGRKVLVTLGGGDPDNVTLKVIRAMNKLELEDLEVRVVIGPSNPHMASLKEAVHHSPFTIHLSPSVRNMSELMAWADVAVSAAGSTCWELAFMGLPSVVLVLAENQSRVAQLLVEKKVLAHSGHAHDGKERDIAQILARLLLSKALRYELSRNGYKLVESLGVTRVMNVLLGA